MTAAHDELAVYGGREPVSVHDARPEVAGIHPVSAKHRFGSAWWQLTLWFTPNVEVSGLFIATLAASLGLGFGWGLAVLLGGEIVGTLVFAWMVTWGPKAGVSQLALARMPFGRSVVLPALVQALTAGGWIGLVSLFGAQAASLLFGIPFWAGATVVLAVVGLLAAFGYQWIHQAEAWFAPVMTVLFGILTVRVLQHHLTLPVQTVHGATLVGAVLLMLAVVLSGSLSWTPYAMDFGRRHPEGTSSWKIFGFAAGGTLAAGIWAALLGLSAASVLGGNQTAAGIRTEVGGGAAGDVALVAIMLARCAELLHERLLLQPGVPGRRGRGPAALAHRCDLRRRAGPGDLDADRLGVRALPGGAAAGRLLGGRIRPDRGDRLAAPAHRVHRGAPAACDAAAPAAAGWPALAAFVVGFAAMVPFMDTTVYEGPVAAALKGGDLAYPVGFAVTGLLYWALQRRSQPLTRSRTPEESAIR